MGKSKFKLFHMVSSSWLYKPNKIGTSKASLAADQVQQQPKQHDYLPTRTSYYISSKERSEKLPRSPINKKLSDTHFPKDSPRKSTRRTERKAAKASSKLASSSLSATSCHHHGTSTSPSQSDEAMEGRPMHGHGNDHFQKSKDLEVVSELKLPPILTKPVKKEVHILHETTNTAARRTASRAHQIKVRSSSPRSSGSKKVLQDRGKQKASTYKLAVQESSVLVDSMVIIKSSMDPQKEFRESMAEMIVENDIRAPKDLEELLACYLSLNSKEYHNIIVKVFKQIWFDLRLGCN